MRKLYLLVVLVICTMHCQDKTPQAHENEQEHGHEHGHEHGQEQEHEPTRVTLWDRDIELFIEFEPIVAGVPTRFITHVTHLDGWRAREQGEIRLVLSTAGQTPIEMTVDKPARRGIYLPDLTFPSAGQWRIEVQVPLDGGVSAQSIEDVTVYASATAIASPASEEIPAAAEIAFLKEQQWIIPFATTAVGEQSFRESLAATGKIIPRAGGLAVVQAPVTGRLASAANFPFRGASVAKGARLAALLPRLEQMPDPAAFTLAVNRSKQDYEFAAKELSRIESLFAEQAVPENRVRKARLEAEQAKAEYEHAQARLRQFDALQSDSASPGNTVTISSPIAGTLLEVNAVPGSLVFEGTQLFRIADLRSVWLEILIPEHAIGRVAQADGASFTVAGLEDNFETGSRTKQAPLTMGAEVDPVQRTLPLTFAVANPDGKLRIGMAAKVAVHTGKTATGLGIPASALSDEGGVMVVYVQRDGEAFERRIVSLGLRDGDTYQVTAGLTSGERVVTTGAYQIRLASTMTNQADAGHVH